VARNNEVVNGSVVRMEHAPDDWGTLLGKLLDDFTRVLQAEIKLLGATIEPAFDTALVRGLNRLILAAMGLCGLLCTMAATVLLLHKWLEWWQAFGATGIGIIVVVLICSLVSSDRSAPIE
jgi:hypothetical protein